MKYAHIINAKLYGWYDSAIHLKIPTPNIKVTDEIWQEALNINANYYEDGRFIVKDFRAFEEIQISALNKQIQEAKAYLSDTSWIWEKYSRNVLSLKELTDEEFQTKYQDIILSQEEARLNINKYEQELIALEIKGAI